MPNNLPIVCQYAENRTLVISDGMTQWPQYHRREEPSILLLLVGLLIWMVKAFCYTMAFIVGLIVTLLILV